MRTWCSKWLELGWRERFVLAFAWGVLPAIVLSLKIFGFRGTKRLLSSLSPCPANRRCPNVGQARRYGKATNIAANKCLVAANCLPRSLCHWWLLRFTGCDSEIRFGVTKERKILQAHAWVEFDGQPLNDTLDVAERYLPLDPVKAATMELDW